MGNPPGRWALLASCPCFDEPLTGPGRIANGERVGFLDILKPKSPVEKAAKQVREPYAQPDYRRGAMDKLFEIGSEEAYTALLGRFTINASGHIADEDEKRELVERLIGAGAAVVKPLERFIASEKNIAFPVKALIGIVGREQGLSFLLETLRAYEPLDHRSTQAKTTLIGTIAELAGPAQASALAPYVGDHHDDVQMAAIEALERLASEDTAGALLAACSEDAHAARVRRRAAQALAELGWPVREAFERFDAELKGEYQLGKKGELVRRATGG